MKFFKNLSIGCGAVTIVGGIIALFQMREALSALSLFLPLLVAVIISGLMWFMLSAIIEHLIGIKEKIDSTYAKVDELTRKLCKDEAPKAAVSASKTFVSQPAAAGLRTCRVCKATYSADRNSCPQCGAPK